MTDTLKPREQISRKERNSNLELFRIIVMLVIVAHHYVVNSGLKGSGGPIYTYLHSMRSMFLLLVGAYGKTGINCFLFITGYFMCKSNISLRKFLKIYGQILFYRFAIYLIFCATGYSVLTVKGFFSRFLPFESLHQNFIGCFMAFWLLIPFLNVLVQNLTKKQHLCLIGLLLWMYTIMSLPQKWLGSEIVFNYVTWFCVLYIISSYVRLHPSEILENTKLWGWITLVTLLVSAASVVVCALYGGGSNAYYFLSDSNKLFAVVLGFSSFNFFRTLKVPYSKLINAFGASTFGVLLIHAQSAAMRKWLWKDVLDCVGAYDLGKMLIVHLVCSVLGIFLVCSLIDMLRIRFIEKPCLALYDRLEAKYRAGHAKEN